MKSSPKKILNKATKPAPQPVMSMPKPKGPPKHYQQDGHWIVKPRKTEVYTCHCGNRYLKTRPHQDECLRCMFGHK